MEGSNQETMKCSGVQPEVSDQRAYRQSANKGANIGSIIKVVQPLEHEYYKLGIYAGLEPSELEVIKHNHPGSTFECLSAVVEKVVNQKECSWCELADVVEKMKEFKQVEATLRQRAKMEGYTITDQTERSKSGQTDPSCETDTQPDLSKMNFECGCGNCTIHDYIQHKACPKPKKEFPFLDIQGASFEADMVKFSLQKQTQEIRKSFAEFREDTFKRLSSKCPYRDVQRYVQRLVYPENQEYPYLRDKAHRGENSVKNANDYEEFEDVLCDSYCSWFNYDILKELRSKFLIEDSEIDEGLRKYEEKFSSYCNHRCFESPQSFHPKPVNEEMKTLVFKVEQNFHEFTQNQVHHIKGIVASVINCPRYAVYVKSVQEGCVEVSCYILPQFATNKSLSQSQISTLKDIDIVSLKINDKELMPAEPKMESGIALHFNLPPSGLALRSVAIVDGVAELRFDSSPKVPTINEEDIATAFRLAVEDKRPEFLYILIPPWHPFFGRQFKHYSPAWLRGTSVGELLAEADWNMKCLHVGARSNETKSEFWSWQKKSHLDGLATRLDFPQDKPPGSIMMSCKSATVQKAENEMVFSEEPKMMIVDDSSSLYSKYITEIYPSVAYYDEPLFLKMQELIKLILATEWLVKKRVNIDKEWMMEQTSKSNQQVSVAEIEGSDSKEPPRALIPPQPTEIKCPTTDVTVKTREAELQQSLAKVGFKKWYGWIDEGGKEMLVFDEDGVQCEQQRSLKLVINQQMDAPGQPGFGEITGWSSFPLCSPDQTSTSTPLSGKFVRQRSLLRAQNSHQEIISCLGRMSLDVKVDEHVSDKDSREVKITKILQVSPPNPAMAPLALKQTTTLKSSVDNYDKLYSNMDPNEPIWPEVPGESEAIIPNVQSWTELFHETVPWPHVLQGTHNDIREYAAESGGVSTKSFLVREEPLVRREVRKETPWVDQYKERNDMLVVQGQRTTIRGQIRRANSQELAQVSSKFTRDWDVKKGACPNVDYVFVVTNSTLLDKWNRYRQVLNDQTVEEYYHGTSVTCNVTSSGRLCPYQSCGICGISNDGLKREFIRKNISFQRFGDGFYLAPNSSKCHDYTKGAYGYRAMLLCDVCPGKKYILQSNSQQMQGPPPGFNSIHGVGGQLNYPEIVIHNPAAVMPRYIIVYRKDGVKHPLAN